MKASIIIPCFNECGTIADVVRQTLQVSLICEKEIIVVDDGSTDGSGVITKGLDNVKLVSHERNRGKGAAIVTGINEASGDILVIQDADMEYFPTFLPHLVEPILDGRADVVLGSRFIGRIEGMSWTHNVANRVLSVVASQVSGVKITDVMTGHKAFRASIIRNMKLQSQEFEVEVELILRAIDRGARGTEIPIDYSYRKASTSKIGWRHGATSLFLLLKLGMELKFRH